MATHLVLKNLSYSRIFPALIALQEKNDHDDDEYEMIRL
jgi:hypothetical protein